MKSNIMSIICDKKHTFVQLFLIQSKILMNITSKQCEDWLQQKQTQDWLQQEEQTQQSEGFQINGFGLDIASWTNNNLKKKSREKHNQGDIQNYYRKRDKKKESELDQITKFNQLAFSQIGKKNNNTTHDIYQRKLSEQLNFKSGQTKLKQNQIEIEFESFHNKRSCLPSQSFFENKNLLNQNKISLKKISKKNTLLNIFCLFLLTLNSFSQSEINILIVTLQILSLILCFTSYFLNFLIVPYEGYSSSDQNFFESQDHSKNTICFQRRILFYRALIYGLLFVYSASILEMLSQNLKNEQMFTIKLFLVILNGFTSFNLIKEAKKVLFLQKEIYFNYQQGRSRFSLPNQQSSAFDFQ